MVLNRWRRLFASLLLIFIYGAVGGLDPGELRAGAAEAFLRKPGIDIGPLIQMKAEATGGNRSRIVTDEAQLVDEEGNVFMKGKHVGKVKPDPHREGWSMWGIEAAGPPFSAPSAATDRSRVVALLKTEGKKTKAKSHFSSKNVFAVPFRVSKQSRHRA